MAVTQVPAEQTGGMILLSTTTLSGSSVSLSSIPQTYNHLQLVIRNFLPSTSVSLLLKVNGLTTDIYKTLGTFPNTNSNTYNDSQVTLASSPDETTQNGLVIFNLFDYKNTTTNKSFTVTSVVNMNDDATNVNFRNTMGAMGLTNAISSLQLIVSSSFTSGTALLYGVK